MTPNFDIASLDETYDFDNTKVNDDTTATAQCTVT